MIMTIVLLSATILLSGCTKQAPLKNSSIDKYTYSYHKNHFLSDDSWEVTISERKNKDNKTILVKYRTTDINKKFYFNSCINMNIPIYKNPYKSYETTGFIKGDTIKDLCNSFVDLSNNGFKYDIKVVRLFQVGGNHPLGQYPNTFRYRN